MSLCFPARMAPHLQPRSTYTRRDSISWGNNFYYLIKLLLLAAAPRCALHTHLSEKPSQTAQKKVSGSSPQTGFYTNHRDHLCISRFLLAQLRACRGPPDKVSPERLLKGCLQVCFPARAYLSPPPLMFH